jgi:hypothetical protein
MVRYALLAIALLIFVMVAITLIVTALIFLTLACVVGVPLWLMSRTWLRRHGLMASAYHPMDRLKNLYVEGKIDLFEFERRVASLISVEH